jgi:hypothetical protein
MKLYLISSKDESPTDEQPFKIYLVAAPSRAAVDELLPQHLLLGVEGELDGTIDHPAGVIGWIGSRTAISINGKT